MNSINPAELGLGRPQDRPRPQPLTEADSPCCDRPDSHYHCSQCGEVTGMYGHLVGDRIICDPGERRAYRVVLALTPPAEDAP
ncbi:hypothetical protein Ssi03_25620 [Sphaerisporangium siamense]|uniref:Uncharacterized protein n=1 Tax=Sphaerisporangium siamense TaxID=795645 RepID=A0A7W7D759_9ACTN|nr:hypothetical protein [Sphaerisporangium siamense]MBB4700113.1 hypothetical protein [Sphaerisporangium siamense]GII84572.1 hypothetical protein Ssi03_25620 [Sphaerisporangium siamense]